MPTAKFLAPHVYIARYAAGTSDQTTKPAAGSFTYIGQVSDFSMTPDVDVREIMQPMPGVMVRNDVKIVSQKIDATFTVQEAHGAICFEVMFKCLALSPGSAVQFNPNEGNGVKGWAKFQFYSEDNVLELVLDLWGILVPAGSYKSLDIASMDLKFMGCHSTLNTASITTLA